MEFTFDIGEMTHVMNVDFGDGRGKVPAHQHIRGGGWVAETAHVDPDCYVGQFAVVYGNARVTGKAIINDHAKVYDDARVYGESKVYGDSQVFGSAQVYGNSRVSGRAKVYGNSKVTDNALVYDDAEVYGDAIVRNNSEILNRARVHGEADIYDSLKVYDDCVVTRKPKACYGFDYNVMISDHHISLGCVSMPPKFIDTTCKRIVRAMGYSPDQIEGWILSLKFIANFHGCENREEDVKNFDERKVIMDLLSGKVGIR